MIEKEIVFESDNKRKASMWYIKADDPIEFFKQAEQLATELSKRSGIELKIKYDFIIFDLKSPEEVQQQNNKYMMTM